ncbi:hypothetical protein KPA93_07855 [Burkholderia cenocepacia]|uniref:hypothetical protein n=1 Tax=Burkholderia cenocepacia TaxID=95486 RepID=UPI0028544104|nr:hypothetical protein [Burkholderia cenocepacia]MDR8031461.1 hypothetical protein [Burkholderia cenocepacia]MDR8040400.1 hypothetical protein [Burkholderia cenocepacia]MDR8076261.1 hypothetical protein [Burkholderia cenocepacia]
MDDVAVIFDNKNFCTDMFIDDVAAFGFVELPVKRKPAGAVVRELLLKEYLVAYGICSVILI